MTVWDTGSCAFPEGQKRAWPSPCLLSRGARSWQDSTPRAQAVGVDQVAAHFTGGTFGGHRDADRAPFPRHSPPHGRTLTFFPPPGRCGEALGVRCYRGGGQPCLLQMGESGWGQWAGSLHQP